MFRVTVIRRFAAAQPRMQPPSASVSQAMRSTVSTPSSSSTSSSSSTTTGRVGMMPGSKAKGAKSQATTTVDNSSNTGMLNSMDDILVVGTVSAQGDGQKVTTAAQSEF